MKKPTFASILKSVRADATSAQARVLGVRANKPAITATLSAASRIAGRAHCYVSAWVNHCGLKQAEVRISLTVSSFNTDKTLNRMLSKAIDLGLESDYSSDYVADWVAERTYRFRDANGGRIQIEARLADEAATCVRVKVGTKLVELDEYEIRC